MQIENTTTDIAIDKCVINKPTGFVSLDREVLSVEDQAKYDAFFGKFSKSKHIISNGDSIEVVRFVDSVIEADLVEETISEADQTVIDNFISLI